MEMNAVTKEKLYARRESGITMVRGFDRPMNPSGHWVVRDRDGDAIGIFLTEISMRQAHANNDLVVFGSEL